MCSYSARHLYAEWEHQKKAGLVSVRSCDRLVFDGIGSYDAYNPARIVLDDGSVLLAVRIEPRHNHDSRIFLFRKAGPVWTPVAEWNPLAMEDPFFVRLPGKLYLGGVATFVRSGGTGLGWITVVYDISDISAPIPVFEGPDGMKDIRFVPYSDGGIGVFTRPQGGKAGRGTVGYVEFDSFESIDSASLATALLLSSPDENSWEGVNVPKLLPDGRVLLLGHVAWMESGTIRHYYAAASVFDRASGIKSSWQIVADRGMLPVGPAKRPDLVDVIFPGAIIRADGSELGLLLGASDAECYALELDQRVLEL